MTILLSELWRAWRASLRRPGFLLLASGVLALGIGTSVAVATPIQNSLWRPLPLPVPQPSRLMVVLGQIHDNGRVGGIAGADGVVRHQDKLHWELIAWIS